MWSRFARRVANSPVTRAVVRAVVLALAELARRWAAEERRRNWPG
jgi:hypothetical protein